MFKLVTYYFSFSQTSENYNSTMSLHEGSLGLEISCTCALRQAWEGLSDGSRAVKHLCWDLTAELLHTFQNSKT